MSNGALKLSQITVNPKNWLGYSLVDKYSDSIRQVWHIGQIQKIADPQIQITLNKYKLKACFDVLDRKNPKVGLE